MQNKKDRLRNKSGKRNRRLSSVSRRLSSMSTKHSCSEEDLTKMDCSSTAQLEQKAGTSTEQEGETSLKREKEKKDKGSRSGKLTDSVVSTSNVEKDNKDITRSIRQSCRKKDTKSISDTLKESLGDYCVRVVKCCPDLDAVLTVVNECHVHEVELFFQAVRLQEPTLVGQLQEQLLDSGSHNRLVTILSEMYA